MDVRAARAGYRASGAAVQIDTWFGSCDVDNLFSSGSFVVHHCIFLVPRAPPAQALRIGGATASWPEPGVFEWLRAWIPAACSVHLPLHIDENLRRAHFEVIRYLVRSQSETNIGSLKVSTLNKPEAKQGMAGLSFPKVVVVVVLPFALALPSKLLSHWGWSGLARQYFQG